MESTESEEALRVSVHLGAQLDVSLTGASGVPRTHRVAVTQPRDGTVSIYRDGSLIEVFYGGQAITTRWYTASRADWTITIDAAGRARCRDVTVWALRDAIRPLLG